MIHIIFGAPGAGKTALMAYFIQDTFKREGRIMLNKTRDQIRSASIECGYPLTEPKKPPIFSDFPVRIIDQYKHYFEPYYLNGYYFGVSNDTMPTIFVPPSSKIFLSEGQRYFDSRQSKYFPPWVSAAFEMHRHYGLEIYIDVQRPKLIDLNIRELCKHFLEVRGIELSYTQMGAVNTTTFHCREFGSSSAVEQYIATGEAEFQEVTFCYKGDIFRLFNSFSHYNDFLPPKDMDFTYLEFSPDNISEELKPFYTHGEPKEYRNKEKNNDH